MIWSVQDALNCADRNMANRKRKFLFFFFSICQMGTSKNGFYLKAEGIKFNKRRGENMWKKGKKYI